MCVLSTVQVFREDHLAKLANRGLPAGLAGLSRRGGGEVVENFLLKFLPLCTSNFYILQDTSSPPPPPQKSGPLNKNNTHTPPKSPAHPVLRSTLICLKIIFIRSRIACQLFRIKSPVIFDL